MDDRCLKAKSTSHVGQVHSQGCIPPTNADRVPQKATWDEACATVESCSVKEVEIEKKINPFFTMKWKQKVESQFVHSTNILADLPHDCQVEETNFWLKKKGSISKCYYKNYSIYERKGKGDSQRV